MNFFEHQDRARTQSRWLIGMFILAVLAIVASIDLVVLLALGSFDIPTGKLHPLSTQSLQHNLPLLAGGAVASVLFVGLASLFKTAKLRAGGGEVARELGATLIEADPRETLHRRLRNVVEEIALASGVPVPAIYVLEQEPGINAFAAGYTPADAAIAVTRGALENLSRDELQGVIAHEFSHILNGDMRVNIRLMGALYGILLLALVGRRVLGRSRRFGRSRGKGASTILLIAFGMMVVGYVGQFFGRWIKAAISRQREHLADASAVQFTRNPDGIGGALKKIAAWRPGSHLAADSEEVSHMLFGDGRRMYLFSTHPPILERIRRIDPGFSSEDLERLAKRMANDRVNGAEKRIEAAAEGSSPSGAAGEAHAGAFEAANLIGEIGQPQLERILMAAALAASLPDNVRQAAQSAEWAPAVLIYSLLAENREAREQQLLLVSQRMGADCEIQVRALFEAGGVPASNLRLPLMELAFPALTRRPTTFLARMLVVLQDLVKLDGRVEAFEYLLVKVLAQHLWESQNPHLARTAGAVNLADCHLEVARVLAVLAVHGQENRASAEAAFRAGMESLPDRGDVVMPMVTDWIATLDTDLPRLDQLGAMEKQQFTGALFRTVTFDGSAVPAELELLRVICSLVHVPLPMLTGNVANPAGPP